MTAVWLIGRAASLTLPEAWTRFTFEGVTYRVSPRQGRRSATAWPV